MKRKTECWAPANLARRDGKSGGEAWCWGCRSLYKLGDLARRRGDPKIGRDHFNDAFAAFETVRVVPDAARIRQLMTKISWPDKTALTASQGLDLGTAWLEPCLCSSLACWIYPQSQQLVVPLGGSNLASTRDSRGSTQ